MTGMRRPELTPALDASQPADHVTRTHPRLIGGSRLSLPGILASDRWRTNVDRSDIGLCALPTCSRFDSA